MVMVEAQRAAKASGLVVRMGGYAHQAEHGLL
jgi:hypothetical protein